MNTKLNKNTARKLVSKLYTANIKEIKTAQNGTRNKVYFVHTLGRESDVVVRISNDSQMHVKYLKEQWCMNRAREEGIPVPEVLEVNNHIVPYPYFVAKYKRGKPGNFYENKDTLYIKMGKILKKIHKIKFADYGEVFDWSHNKLSRISTWQSYLKSNFDINQTILVYKNYKIISDKYLERMDFVYNDMIKFKFEPVLCHNDFLDKNILVDSNGKIISVLDWELAISSHPFRDLGKTWRGIVYYSNEEKAEKFFKGYGMKRSKYIKFRDYMYLFDFITDCETLLKHIKDKNVKEIERIKNFWNNYFDNGVKLENSVEKYEENKQ